MAQTRVTWDLETSGEEQPPSNRSVAMSKGGIFLIDLWARGQPTVGGTIPGQVGPWVV